ncbi:hypothetical protein BH11BAC7_BH11BAC7_16810 [soil metagenome]
MKKSLFFFATVLTIPALAQFHYSGWNLGPQVGKLKIQNSMTRYATDFNNKVYVADSANSEFGLINLRFNIEVLHTNYYIKTGLSLPVAKRHDPDSVTVLGKHMEIDIKFGYGFQVKEKVGFQFGMNMGVFNITQSRNLKLPGTERIDYFEPSALSSSSTGQKYFGGMAAWQVGLMVTNVIAFSDQLALRTSYSHNNLKNKKKTIDGRNDQLEFGLYFSDTDRHNLGFHISFVQNWMHFKDFNPNEPRYSYSSGRQYPATKATMTTFYIGVNIPIVFAD